MSAAPSPKKRVSVHGVILLDKPVGLSSNDALVRAKRKLNAKKAGHTGTLDPFATGLLPLCFGEATKFAQDLLNADKTYETTVFLGARTSTGDTEGEIVSRGDADRITREDIEAILPRFTGEIDQVPPMYSALKRDGKPLYEYARAGIELEREARRVAIHEMALLDFSPPFLTLRVSCSKGTYIRVLGEDIGEALGCGAHLQTLRRVKVGSLEIDHASALADIEKVDDLQAAAFLKPVDYLLSTFPAIHLSEEQARRFMHGQRLSMEKEKPPVFNSAERVRVYDAARKRLLGTAIIKPGNVLAPERLIAV
ncbi:tRNA pseudouridine(55) synthase TruB [Oxalobacter vibrioformis]|uniref:tRNA pseudouridine synthase B n=1 Tax=Oxalobacter vibrioformis TaxID=933080 RepID=A0A9E9P430_9BURK|nr:tRNA pseudouridine(55) synthase TruB [Oxalobacter vibrioformis]WAW10678.1 tRNA pseudouridine(55) synthase TruB [Oxalobacter vibrioformis]